MRFNQIFTYETNSLPREKRELTKFFEKIIGVLTVCIILAFYSWMALDLFVFADVLTCLIPWFVMGGILVIVSVVSAVKFAKIKVRLSIHIGERLANDFYEKDYHESKQQLIEKKIIAEDGFVNNRCDRADNSTIPFEQVKITFSTAIICGVLQIEAETCFNDISTNCVIDNDYYNFLMNNTDMITNKKAFALFCADKKEYARLLVRYNDASKIEMAL